MSGAKSGSSRYTRSELNLTLSNLRTQLLSLQSPEGYWEGTLSSSALATATATLALSIVDHDRHPALIHAGLDWLAQNQNEDGGWGDTTNSISNLSTTVLCWSALSLNSNANRKAILNTETWLKQNLGDLNPPKLVRSILSRYGEDRTFSVPILATCAMAGRLGEPDEAWRWVKALPFELAACPHRWFKWLQLPVVSYALPALIALGQVRHFYRPTKNPITRLLRALTRQRTLNVLTEIQPASGGFLEAIPLTAFVVMSLAKMNKKEHPVTKKGVEFLTKSVREDGSWPIDTHLATWVTTLSVNALANHQDIAPLSVEQRHTLRDWLLKQQNKSVHPFTHAAPGGWAWTPLSGGVPDADDTPGALLALHNLALMDGPVLQAVEQGIDWLLKLQNRDGGMPTFCRGWGRLPFDRSSPDLTAHTLRAFAVWKPHLSQAYQVKLEEAIAKALTYLLQMQQHNGAWIPLWFGNQRDPMDQNPTYGTSRVLVALSRLIAEYGVRIQPALLGGVRWLLHAQNKDGGWGGNIDLPSTIEETAITVEALARVVKSIESSGTSLAIGQHAHNIRAAIESGGFWLIEKTDCGTSLPPPTPIGLYFAKLWYFEYLYPLVFAVSALSQLRELLVDEASINPADAISRN